MTQQLPLFDHYPIALPRRMKPKVNRGGTIATARSSDSCQTPASALAPLLPDIPHHWVIWEPACGEGSLVTACAAEGRTVVGSDILTGTNFFLSPGPERWNCIVTNPPYSIKYPWLERCYALGKPFALLLPVETLGAKRAQVLFIAHGVQVIFLDRRVNFKMPNLGWDGGGAQFPTAWFTFGLNLPSAMVFRQMPR